MEEYIQSHGHAPGPLNESPSEKEGKSGAPVTAHTPPPVWPSMKVPPKRKGNL